MHFPRRFVFKVTIVILWQRKEDRIQRNTLTFWNEIDHGHLLCKITKHAIELRSNIPKDK